MKQVHVTISGQVQGVWYRKFVEKNANKLGLKGWVRNLEDNRVEAVLQGRIRDIEKMVELCKGGPPLAEVKNVDFKWEESEEEFGNFMII